MENKGQELAARMSGVDWWYGYSDDANTRRKGAAAVTQVVEELRALASSDLDLAQKLWVEHAPKEYAKPAWLAGESLEQDAAPSEGIQAGSSGTVEEDSIRQAEQANAREASQEDSIRPAILAEPDNMIRPAAPTRDAAPQSLQANSAAEGSKGAQTLLNGRFIRGEDHVYRRVGETREALADEGDRIRFIDKQMDAFQAGVELARQKGWQAIEVTGTETFRAEAWFHARAAGLEVIGFEPSKADLARLEAYRPGDGQHAEVSAEHVASKADAEQFAFGEGFGVVGVNPSRGRYSGVVLKTFPHHVVQEVGKNSVAIHDTSKFDEATLAQLAPQTRVAIQYQAGRAGIEAPTKRSAELGR